MESFCLVTVWWLLTRLTVFPYYLSQKRLPRIYIQNKVFESNNASDLSKEVCKPRVRIIIKRTWFCTFYSPNISSIIKVLFAHDGEKNNLSYTMDVVYSCMYPSLFSFYIWTFYIYIYIINIILDTQNLTQLCLSDVFKCTIKLHFLSLIEINEM